jgi:GTP cyclohydrolase I
VNPTLVGTPPALAGDVQSEKDVRGIAIDQVGIRGLRYPILVEGDDGPQPSIACWELTVGLQADHRGTHMSRFVETLESWGDAPMDGPRLLAMLADVRERLDTTSAEATCAFTLFLHRRAPVSGLLARHGIDCTFEALSRAGGDELALRVRVPVTTLCPCSKEISEYGAHNQRGYVEITARTGSASTLTFGDLIAVAERSGSAVIYPLLKRVDERHVTMQAYDSPTFVEDVVRNAALNLTADRRIEAFIVEAENQESIHDHSAVASIRWERP